jgi:hypothetical protein
MVSMADELEERNILKLILIVRFACATLDLGHPILTQQLSFRLETQFLPHSQSWLGSISLEGQSLRSSEIHN